MHNVGLKKRGGAYFIDISLFIGIILLFMCFIPESHNIVVLNQEFDSMNDMLFSHQMSFFNYITRISNIMQDLDKERVLYSLINAIYILVYFVLIPYKTKKTFGMYIMKIHYDKKDGKVTLDDLLIRSMITCGLLYLLASLVLIYLLPAIPYFLLNIFFAIIQISLVIISIFMVIYRHDNKGLQDLFSNTLIIKDENKN